MRLLKLTLVGVLSVGVGFALWFLFLYTADTWTRFQISKHAGQSGNRPASIFDSIVFLGGVYALVFFLSAFLIGSRKWSVGCHWSSLTVYAVVLVVLQFSTSLSQTVGPRYLIVFALPLVTVFAGGYLGERLKRRWRGYQSDGANVALGAPHSSS